MREETSAHIEQLWAGGLVKKFTLDEFDLPVNQAGMHLILPSTLADLLDAKLLLLALGVNTYFTSFQVNNSDDIKFERLLGYFTTSMRYNMSIQELVFDGVQAGPDWAAFWGSLHANSALNFPSHIPIILIIRGSTSQEACVEALPSGGRQKALLGPGGVD